MTVSQGRLPVDRRRRRRTLVAVLCGTVFLGGLTAAVAWRSFQVLRVPAPFDSTHLGTIGVPDARNAFAYYDRCELTDPPDGVVAALRRTWPDVKAEFYGWLEENSDARQRFLAGSQQSQAVSRQPKDHSEPAAVSVIDHAGLSRLARLSAARCCSCGDLDEAFVWLRAAFRHSRHVGMYGPIIDRQLGVNLHRVVCRDLQRWAGDPGVDAQLLQRALHALQEDYRLTQPYSTVLRSEYFQVLHELGPSRGVASTDSDQASIPLLHPARLRWGLVNMTYANWLAHIDWPRKTRPPQRPQFPYLFAVSDAAPQAVGLSLPPRELELYLKWFPVQSEHFCDALKAEAWIERERTEQSQLVAALGLQVFVRRQGRFPDSLEEFRAANIIDWPRDPYSFELSPLRYRGDNQGQSATIWSVGRNGIDDNGNVDVNAYDPHFDLGRTLVLPPGLSPHASQSRADVLPQPPTSAAAGSS